MTRSQVKPLGTFPGADDHHQMHVHRTLSHLLEEVCMKDGLIAARIASLTLSISVVGPSRYEVPESMIA